MSSVMAFFTYWFRRYYVRLAVMLLADLVIVTLAYYTAYWFRIDILESASRHYFGPEYVFATLPWLLAIRIVFNWLCKQYHWSFRHASLSEGVDLVLSLVMGTAVFALLGHGTDLFPRSPPRSIYVLEPALSLAGMWLLRFFPKYLLGVSYRYYRFFGGKKKENIQRILIMGCGNNADLLARELMRSQGHNYYLVGFIDDNPVYWKSHIHGIRVLGGTRELAGILKRSRIDQILLTGPALSGQELRRLVDMCEPYQVKMKRIPGYQFLLNTENGGRKFEDISPMELLDRQPVHFDTVKMKQFLAGKSILVTGAAGSIGSELCRQAAGFGLKRLVLFDINENDLYYLQSELREKWPGLDTVMEIGSIRDRPRLDEVMARHRPDVVFHAAAHKHVPILETAPGEAIKNNILGTFEVADCAQSHGVKRFVLVSTDKAATSTNVLGASKRLAERVVRHLNRRGGTDFSIVRFGNVLGSSGSLLQIVRRQIDKGGPVTVTDKRMTRYFMTIEEAVGLVLVASALREGEICVLDMGEPIAIDKLVRQIVFLAGHTPDQDMEIRYTTPRPGERLSEQLYAPGEVAKPSSFPRIRIAEDHENTDDVEAMLAAARQTAAANDDETARAFLRRWVPIKD